VSDDGTVAEMVNEVLLRQAKARADRTGEPIEAAMGAVVRTESGRQLAALGDGPHADEGVEEWQAGIARERTRERAKDTGGRLGEGVPGHPTHG
jgi:hypothetical protein